MSHHIKKGRKKKYFLVWTPADKSPYQFLFLIIAFQELRFLIKSPEIDTIFCWQLQQAPRHDWMSVWKLTGLLLIKSKAFQNALYIYRILGCQSPGESAGVFFFFFLIRVPSDLAGRELSVKICVSRQGFCFGFSVVEVKMLLCRLQKLIKPPAAERKDGPCITLIASFLPCNHSICVSTFVFWISTIRKCSSCAVYLLTYFILISFTY